MTTQKLQQIPLKEIILSGDNQRQIDEKSEDIQELAASIKGGGVNSAIELSPDPKHKGKFILISGERRFTASKVAGTETIPAIVISEVSDTERVGRMSVENMFHKDLAPMEQAAQIALWMERVGGDVKFIAQRLGKTERWVRTRAHIVTGLIKPWQTLLADKDKDGRFKGWTISHWLEVARLPEHLQAQMHKELTTEWAHPERLTALDLEHSAAKVMHLLSKAKWDLDDETILPKAGACSKCPKRTGHQPILWFDSEDQVQAGDQCMDSLCYQSKQAAWVARQAKELRDKHPKLVLIAKDNPGDKEAIALREQVGSYLPNWEYKPASKTGKGAVPAMYVNGNAAGKLTYVKINDVSTGERTSSGRGFGVPTPLKTRKAQLDAKRWSQVLLDLRDKVRGTEVPQITYKDKLTAVMGMVAWYGNKEQLDVRGDDRRVEVEKLIKSKTGQEKALDLLWQTFKPTLDELLTWGGPVSQTPEHLKKEAEWISGLIGADLTAMFKDISGRKGFTVPKSWAGLNADGTPKADKKAKKRICRICGCAEDNACVVDGVPCHWVKPDLCSACEANAEKKAKKAESTEASKVA